MVKLRALTTLFLSVFASMVVLLVYASALRGNSPRVATFVTPATFAGAGKAAHGAQRTAHGKTEHE